MGKENNEHEHVEEVVSRLAKIEGHIRGIKKMLMEGKPCDQILLQLSAVKAALNKSTVILLQDHYDHCLVGKNKSKELENALRQFRKILEEFVS